MTPERHARVKELFVAASEGESGERTTFLRGACDDESVRAEVLELLRHHDAEDDGPLLEGDLYAERYRVLALLGRGGGGEVYRADDLRLGVPVALKRMHGKAANVIAEVRLARQITHPAVCRVYDIGEHDGEAFFTMEYVEGEDLASVLRREGPLPEARVLAIARQLCGALAAAHARGILHRDLKPANVLCDRNGNVRLTDFGIAVEARQEQTLIAGTPAYMAPEQIAGATVTERSDLFALGALLYELLSGRPPFPGFRRDRRPAPLAQFVDLDPQIERAVLCALEINPDARPQSALAFAAMLGVDTLDVAAAAGVTPAPEAVALAAGAPRLTSRAALALAVGALALFALTLAIADRAFPLRAGAAKTAVPSHEGTALVILALLVIASALAAANLRRKRGDRKGARRLATFVGVLTLAPFFVRDTPAIRVAELAVACATVAFAWIGYIALEPWLRRHSPRTLVAWVRLLHGRLADPLIGRELLIGLACGGALMLLGELHQLAAPRFGLAPAPDMTARQLATASHWRELALVVLSIPVRVIVEGVLFLLVLVALRLVIRRRRVASTAFVILAAFIGSGGQLSLASVATLGIAFGLLTLFLLHEGFIAFVAAAFVPNLLRAVPLTLDASAAYAPTGYAALALLAAATLGALAMTRVSQN